MRLCASIVVLGMAALAVGCGKGPSNAGGAWGSSPGKSGGPRSTQRSMPANAEALQQAFGFYLDRPEVLVKEPTFLAISEPIKIKRADGTALAYWAQYTATNSYGDPVLAQHDLFILKDDKVIDHCRTTEEVREKLGTRWVDENPPPPWPDVLPPKITKSKVKG